MVRGATTHGHAGVLTDGDLAEPNVTPATRSGMFGVRIGPTSRPRPLPPTRREADRTTSTLS